jgi:alpha-glucosidase
LTVSAQEGEPESMLRLYRAALRIRRAESGLGDGPLRWLPSPDGVIAFARGPGFVSITNLTGSAFALPAHAVALLASHDVSTGYLPNDATAWLRIAEEEQE